MEEKRVHSSIKGILCLVVLVIRVLSSNGLPFLSQPRGHLVDLSYPYDNNTVVWVNSTPFQFTEQLTEYVPPENYFFAVNTFKMAEHCGTHLDAPYHFNENGWKVGDIPVERLITVGAFVNASSETNGNPNYTLPVSKLVEWERKNGRFPMNSVVIVSFGWTSLYDSGIYLKRNGQLSFPGLSKEAAEWIVKTKRVIGVGVDTASVDPGSSPDFIVHRILLGSSLYHLENLAIKKPLPPLVQLIVMPMKIANGTGAPVRVTAII